MTTALSERVERSKAEILADIRDGVVPPSVASVTDLNDYVDANEYGGLEDDARRDMSAGIGSGDLDAWLVKARFRRAGRRVAREGSAVSAATNRHGDTQAGSYTLQRYDGSDAGN